MDNLLPSHLALYVNNNNLLDKLKQLEELITKYYNELSNNDSD